MGWRTRAATALLDDIDLFGLREREMRDVRGGKIAMIFQEPGLSLNPVMTVGEQIAEVLALHGSFISPTPTPPGLPLSGEEARLPPLTRGGTGRGLISSAA